MPSKRRSLLAAAGNAGSDPLYVEDVFSNYLYEGNGATGQSIVNNIDLSGEGGLVWGKSRDSNANQTLYDTERGVQKPLFTDSTVAEQDDSSGGSTKGLYQFNSDGFTVGDDWAAAINLNNDDYVSWTFRKAEKFFDIVTYTGDGASGRLLDHNLGTAPGMVLVKSTSAAANWSVYAVGLGPTAYLLLNTTAAYALSGFSRTVSSTQYELGPNWPDENQNGREYVAYFFGNAVGGFGEDGTENIIKCGDFTTDASGAGLVGPDLGFEPQWVLLKNATSTASGGWWMFDAMRGFTASGGGTSYLLANSSGAEGTFGGETLNITSNGFTMPSDAFASGQTFIYMAIRRPMKTPEAGTEVFAPVGATTTAPLWKSSFPVDVGWYRYIIGTSAGTYLGSRLTGTGRLQSSSTAAEATDGSFKWDYMNGWFDNSFNDTNYVGYNFKRATGFMDVVAYTGTGAGLSVAHNLGVAPEMIWVKNRDSSYSWTVYAAPLGTSSWLYLETAGAASTANNPGFNAIGDTTFGVGSSVAVNGNTQGILAYLFATLAGVSKVGSYTGTGTGTTVDVDCGFTGGARFILIKRTDSAGDWFVYDSFRGINAGDSPYFFMNTTSGQVNTDYIDPLNAGFTVTTDAAVTGTLNVSGATYIFLAIA